MSIGWSPTAWPGAARRKRQADHARAREPVCYVLAASNSFLRTVYAIGEARLDSARFDRKAWPFWGRAFNRARVHNPFTRLAARDVG